MVLRFSLTPQSILVLEIVMIKKKKSQVALNRLAWGALSEVTNIPKLPPKEAAPIIKGEGEMVDSWARAEGFQGEDEGEQGK